MNDITPIFKDAYLWSGLALLASSVFGLFWVLKALQNHAEDAESLMVPMPPAPAGEPLTRIEPVKERPAAPSAEFRAQAANQRFERPAAPAQRFEKPVPRPQVQDEASDRTQMLAPASEDDVSPLDRLSEQIIHLERRLTRISEQLDGIRQDKDPKKDLTADIQAALQAVKAGGAGDSGQLGQLSAKMDKIYNILVKLSGSDPK